MAIDVAKRYWYPVLALVLNLTCLHAGERWSRQLTEYGNIQGNDWIPLSHRPGDRQAGAKVLNYFDNSGFLGTDNSAQPQHHQFSFVNQQFPQPQTSRLVFPPQPAAQPLQQQELEPAFNQPFGNHQAFLHQSPFGGVQTFQRHPLPPQLAKEAAIQQEKPSILEQPQFQFQPQAPSNNLRQHVLPGGQHPLQGPHPLQGQPGGGISQEEVQLLYVPVETLYNQKQNAESARFNTLPQPVSASLINDFYTAATTTAKPRTTNTPYTTKATTKATQPTKPKPNQPPLAMFMYNDDKQSKITVAEALVNLKNVQQISVLDSLNKNLPKVFIGPSGLAPPKGYSKFELPYLSNIENSRFDLPFFVAPLSYKTPGGFSKIPLPAPQVGSVIVQQTSASTQANNFFRQPDNIEYYQPATLKFTESTTNLPATLPPSKPQYDSDHYTSPTSKPTTDRTQYSRGNTQTPQESYRQPQTERALYSHSPFNSVSNLPNRHVVNEEYFNLAKTKKPTTQSPPSNYSPKTYKPFEFKPIPEHKIPVYSEPEDQTPVFTTAKPATTTTEKVVQSTRSEETRMKSYFKEENFRSRRPYNPPTTAPQYEEEEEATVPVRNNHEEEHFVHKFKLVDSVRPQPTQSPKSVIDNAFLEFFHQDNHDMHKTVVTNNSPNGGQQVVRNNYFSPNTNDEPPKQKFVSKYYAPTTIATPTRTTTTTTTPSPKPVSTEDSFFKEFDEKSRQYEKDPPRYLQHTRPAEPAYISSQESFLNRFTEPSYTNKYKYETNTNGEAHYPVEVVTTQDPVRFDTTSDAPQVTGPSSEQSYSIPSELPPISANLPGLVNSLMEDEWAHKKGEQDSSSPATGTTKGNFRKQVYRTTTAPTTPETYAQEVTTRRSRGRRPTSSTTTHDSSAGPTRSSQMNRNRSRYVPSADEKPASRGRVRSRVQSTPRVAKEEENLEYQRDVLNQNYPVIRPLGRASTTTTTPPPTTSTTTTYATTIPVTFQQMYEEQTERLNPYLATEAEHVPEIPNVEEVSIPKKESYYNENYYETDVTSAFPQTTRQNVQYSTQYQDDESVRVLPVDHPVEPPREVAVKQVVETHREQPVYNHRRQPVKQEEPVTPSYSQTTEQEVHKVEITPRPRRPLSRQPVYSPRSTTATERATTERSTTESSRGSSQRRPAFVRRPARPLYTTTATVPTTTYSSRGYTGDDEQPTQGSFTVRPKSRQDILRARTRRPATTTAAAPTTASPEPSVNRGFARNKELRRVSPTTRSRQEQQQQPQEQQQQQTETATQSPRFRIRERTRFNLQPQETQWSTKLNQNSFQPVQDVESRHKNYDEEYPSNEPEPEIVTASALLEQQDENVQLVEVSANMGGPTVTGAGVVTNEVALSQAPPQADQTEENSNVPSFAELLNDVMKEFIDDNIQQTEPATESKTVENEVLIEEKKPTVTVPQRKQPLPTSSGSERKPVTGRNTFNFRKRGRSHVVDSFETAESQHINSHVYNTAGFESLKSIDKAHLRGKNLEDEAKGSTLVEENTAQEATTTTSPVEPEVTTLPETTTSVMPETTLAVEITSILPTEKEVTTPLPILEVQLDEEEPASTEQIYDDEESDATQAEPVGSTDDHGQGIFADVKKQISDLFAMAENDPETEEVEDDEHYLPQAMGYHAVERTSTEEPEVVATQTSATTTDMAPNENQFVAVTEPAPQATGSMAIPTSTSNGITHETEICYRGRCVKTDEKKQKKNKFKPN